MVFEEHFKTRLSLTSEPVREFFMTVVPLIAHDYFMTCLRAVIIHSPGEVNQYNIYIYIFFFFFFFLPVTDNCPTLISVRERLAVEDYVSRSEDQTPIFLVPAGQCIQPT